MPDSPEADDQPKGARLIEVLAETKTIEGWRKQVIAGQPDAGMFALVSDEGEYKPGGEGTAPTPLTYFVAGVALWLHSQVTQVALTKKLKIEKDSVKVSARFHEQGSVLAGTKTGECLGFEIELSLDSSEPDESILQLVQLAREMCFTEDALTSQVDLSVRSVLNGEPIGHSWSWSNLINTVALFDVDGTLYDAELGRELLSYLLKTDSSIRPRVYLAGITPHYLLYKAGIKTHESFVRLAVTLQGWLIRGWTIERGREVLSRVVNERLLPRERTSITQRLKRHLSEGDLVVLVSGMIRPCLELLDQHFGVSMSIGTVLEIRDGRYTGRLGSPVVTGADKERQLMRHLGSSGIDVDWARSYAYGDAMQDVPLLKLVGNPTVVSPGPRLRKIAQDLDWGILEG